MNPTPAEDSGIANDQSVYDARAATARRAQPPTITSRIPAHHTVANSQVAVVIADVHEAPTKPFSEVVGDDAILDDRGAAAGDVDPCA